MYEKDAGRKVCVCNSISFWSKRNITISDRNSCILNVQWGITKQTQINLSWMDITLTTPATTESHRRIINMPSMETETDEGSSTTSDGTGDGGDMNPPSFIVTPIRPPHSGASHQWWMWVFYHPHFSRWERLTQTLFLQFFHSFIQTPHYSRSVSLAALCLRSLQLPPLPLPLLLFSFSSPALGLTGWWLAVLL